MVFISRRYYVLYTYRRDVYTERSSVTRSNRIRLPRVHRYMSILCYIYQTYIENCCEYNFLYIILYIYITILRILTRQWIRINNDNQSRAMRTHLIQYVYKRSAIVIIYIEHNIYICTRFEISALTRFIAIIYLYIWKLCCFVIYE